jgi:GNAT superfamily N-acetyltransferase
MTIETVSFNTIASIHKQIPEFDTSASSTSQFFEQRTASAYTYAIAAKIDDTYVGYLVAYDRYADNSLYCWMVGVIPAARKQGVLSALMQDMIAHARSQGYTHIRIKTRNRRREMLQYLIAKGYNIIGIKKHPHIGDHRISCILSI